MAALGRRGGDLYGKSFFVVLDVFFVVLNVFFVILNAVKDLAPQHLGPYLGRTGD